MKFVIVFAAVVAVALAAPQGADKDAVVTKQNLENIGVDGYQFNYETSNGIAQEEQGQLQNAGSEKEAISVRGSYSYTGPDNVKYQVNYVANEDGFQAEGAHIPKDQ